MWRDDKTTALTGVNGTTNPAERGSRGFVKKVGYAANANDRVNESLVSLNPMTFLSLSRRQKTMMLKLLHNHIL